MDSWGIIEAIAIMTRIQDICIEGPYVQGKQKDRFAEAKKWFEPLVRAVEFIRL